MSNPLRYQQAAGVPSLEFYRAWLHDKRAVGEDKALREALWFKIQGRHPEEIANHFFSTVRHCTPSQLAELADHLEREQFGLMHDALPNAIVEFGAQGSLAKVRALFSLTQWDRFKIGLGLHESLSGRYMPLYVNDVIAWCEASVAPQEKESDHLLMRVSLNQCPCSTAEVVSVMQLLDTPNLQDRPNIILATDDAVSLVYDTPPEMRATNAKKLVEQLTRLHDGWGIRYPAAVLTRILQKQHSMDFFLPPLATMNYEGREDDASLAVLFGAKPAEQVAQKSEAVFTGMLVEALYDEDNALAFCIAGSLGPLVKPSYFVPPAGVFHDVGHP